MKSRKLRRNNATFIEYALLAGLVAIVVAVAVMAFGGKLTSLFSDTAEKVEQVDTTVQGVSLAP